MTEILLMVALLACASAARYAVGRTNYLAIVRRRIAPRVALYADQSNSDALGTVAWARVLTQSTTVGDTNEAAIRELRPLAPVVATGGGTAGALGGARPS